MTTSDYLVVIQIITTILMTGIGYLLKNVIESNLSPIKTDINGMKNEIKEINEFLKDHRGDQFAHPQMLAYLDSKYVTKNEMDSMETLIRVWAERNKDRDNHGNN